MWSSQMGNKTDISLFNFFKRVITLWCIFSITQREILPVHAYPVSNLNFKNKKEDDLH